MNVKVIVVNLYHNQIIFLVGVTLYFLDNIYKKCWYMTQHNNMATQYVAMYMIFSKNG